MILFAPSLDILSTGISNAFQLFGQFISYLINLPASAWAYIAMIFANSISTYNNLILPMMVIVFGITFLIAYTIISTAKTADSDVNIGALMEGIE
jgi:transcriptional antiterminator